MNTGLYTTEKPSGAKRPEAAIKAAKPTAGREADRLPQKIIQELADVGLPQPVEDVKVEVKEEEAPKPARKTPRHRSDA